MEIESINKYLSENQELHNEIKKLISIISEKKKFIFQQEELQFEISNLKTELILVQENGKLKISDSTLFFLSFYNHYKLKYSFELTDNIKSAFDFVDIVDSEFNDNGVINGRYEFFNNFKTFILTFVHVKFKTDFSQYVLTLKKDPYNKGLYDFNSAFCKALPDLNIDPKIIYRNLHHLYHEVSSDVDFNSNVSEIGNALRKLSSTNVTKGRKLLEFAIGNKYSMVPNLTIGTIAGIYEVEREKFHVELSELIKEPKYYTSIVYALSSIEELSNQEAQANLDFIQLIPLTEDDVIISLPRFYVSKIENKNITAEKIKNDCFNKLDELISHSSQNARMSVLRHIKFLKGFDEKINNLLFKLLSLEDYNKNCNIAISETFYSQLEVHGYFEFLIKYAIKFKLSFSAKDFESSIYHFKSKEPEFSKGVINLLIHDKGEVRFIGNRIVTHLHLLNDNFKFSIDILSLSAIQQYKLWVSLMEDFREPKYSLPLLLPLINSQYSFVQEAFICKLEELTENYFSSVINVMKEILDSKNIHHQEVISRIQKYYDGICNLLDKKNNVKELNPFYTQSKLINYFDKEFKTSFSERTDKGINENSIFSLFANTVILAKGGGWMHENHSTVSKLSQVRHSFSLPRRAFIEGEHFDWEFQCNFLTNWEKEFEEWEATISL